MAATIISSSAATSVVFGCTAETGILINSFSRTTSREKAEVTDNDGDVVAVSYFKPMAPFSISGVVNGTTGVAAAAPGVALTLNSTTSGNGVTTGKLCVDTVTINRTSEAFNDISVDGVQYPELT
jgi:hypothetical protein